MQSIFAEPTAHGVRNIEAEITDTAMGTHCLTLNLSGRKLFGEPSEGAFEIYGGPEVAGKFKAVAEAINRIFGNKTVEEEARP